MPWRLSRSHLNGLFVMCKNLSNLQPAFSAWQSLVYCTDVVSWVIIFLKPFFFSFYSAHLENMPRHGVDFPRLPWDPLGLASLALMEMLPGWCLQSYFSAPDPRTELWWMSRCTQLVPYRPTTPAMGSVGWSGIQDPHKRTEVAPSWLRNGSQCWHYKSLLDPKLPYRPKPRVCCPWPILKAE